MTRRSDAVALALSGTVHAAAICAALAMVAHDRLPALPFVIDLTEMVSDAREVAPPPPTPPHIRPAQPIRRVEPPRRAEPVVATPPAPVAVAPAPPPAAPATPATASEATLVAPEPVASPAINAAATPAPDARTEADSSGSTMAPVHAPRAATPPAVAALPPAPPAALPVTRAARPRGGYQVQPAYPAEARRANAEGTTVLRVHVGADGAIDDVLVERSAGHDALDRAAAEAIRKWRFEPARNAAGAVAVWVVVPVNFHFRSE
jgi:protein TonB